MKTPKILRITIVRELPEIFAPAEMTHAETRDHLINTWGYEGIIGELFDSEHCDVTVTIH